MIIFEMLRPRKLPARAIVIVFPLVMSTLMSFVISAIATWRGFGFAPDFFARWMQTWGISWMIAFPTVILIMPVVRRVLALIIEEPVASKP